MVGPSEMSCYFVNRTHVRFDLLTPFARDLNQPHKRRPRSHFDTAATSGEPVEILSGAFARSSVLSMNTDEAHRRAEALFKKEQQSHEAQQAMTEYEAELQAMREKTARLRALRMARDAEQENLASTNKHASAKKDK